MFSARWCPACSSLMTRSFTFCCVLTALRWIPASPASAREVSSTGPEWGQGSYSGRWHHHHYPGESQEGSSRSDKESGGNRYRYAGGGDCVSAVSVSLFCLQQHLFHYGVSKPGLTLTHTISYVIEIRCNISVLYLSLSHFCTMFCFQMHFLYQYSLHFFLDIYHTVLYENSNLKSVSDHTQRLSVITKDLFQVRTLPAFIYSSDFKKVTYHAYFAQVAFNRVAQGMLHQDHITFAVLLARINLKGLTR